MLFFAGLLIAGAIGALAIIVDFYSELSARFPPVIVRRYALATRPWQLFAFVVFWAVVCVGFALAIFLQPAWANRAFQIKVEESFLEAGFVIGCSAMLLIRSQLGKLGNFNLGFEFPYAVSRDGVIEAWHRHRIASRNAMLAAEQQFYRNGSAHRCYGRSLLLFLRERAEAVPAKEKDKVVQELNTIEARGDIESTPARKALVGFALDYFGARYVKEWADGTDRGNRDPHIDEG